MIPTRTFLIICLIGLTATAASATTGEPAQTPSSPPPCATVEYRQFDFWLGEWNVKNAAGDIVGTNRIESILGGCVLQESWSSRTGSVGHSFNIYDRATGRWHQTWVDNSGLLLSLDGGREGDSMVLTGERVAPTGAPVRHQIRWQARLDGSVRQLWQSSTDGGQTWSTVFDGLYERMER